MVLDQQIPNVVLNKMDSHPVSLTGIEKLDGDDDELIRRSAVHNELASA